MATLVESISLMLCLFLWLSTALDTDASPRRHRKKSGHKEEQIIGGGNAAEGEFPFMALITMRNHLKAVKSCGGSIIDERHILTAAHCVMEGTNPQVDDDKKDLKIWHPYYIDIRLGCHQRSKCSEEGTLYQLDRVIIHPDYKKSHTKDIALLKTGRQIRFNNKTGKGAIRPVEIATSNEECCDKKPVIATAVGWGWLDNNSTMADHLKKVSLESKTYQECKRNYPSIDEGIMCVSNIKEGPCFGDSGGPLLRPEDGSQLQVGVFSFLSSWNCVDEKGGGFTKIGPYRVWIYKCTITNNCKFLITNGFYPRP